MKVANLSGMQELVSAFSTYLSVEKHRAAGTVKRYGRVLNRFETFLQKRYPGVDVELASVKKDDLRWFLYQASGTEETPSPSVWNNTRAALRAFYTYLLKQELAMRDPTDLVDRQEYEPDGERLPLSFDEMLSLVEAAERHSPAGYASRNVAIIVIFLHCSLRLAEVESLSLGTIDFVNRWFLNVRLKRGKKLAVLFNDVVAGALEAYLPDRMKLLAGKDEDALFVSTQKRRLSKRAIEDIINRYGELAGVKRSVFPHLLRHTSATEYLDITDMIGVRDQLGHKDVRTTQTYTHGKVATRRKANDEFGRRWEVERRKRGGASRRRRAPAGAAAQTA